MINRTIIREAMESDFQRITGDNTKTGKWVEMFYRVIAEEGYEPFIVYKVIIDRMKKGQEVIIHGDGTSLWTITHSDDFAKAFVGLLGHQQAIGHAFHITSDELLNWNQIYDAVSQAAGTDLNAVHIASDFICDVGDTIGWEWMRGNLLGDKAVSTIFDNTKIKRFVPGFEAKITFKEGIKKTVKWFEADPARMVIDEGNNSFIDTVLKAYRGG